jgi:hypothetical protein
MWESDAYCHFEGEWKYLLSCDRPRLDSFLTGLRAFAGHVRTLWESVGEWNVIGDSLPVRDVVS